MAEHKFHRVQLSNGQYLRIEEFDNSISLATDDGPHAHDVDMYIASISPDGVLVMPNSGGATDTLTRGLRNARYE